MDKSDHWDGIYGRKAEAELSWHEDDPAHSLALLRQAGLAPDSAVIDIGAGTSRLADSLLAAGLRDITLLDLSQAALAVTRARLGDAGATLHWVAADVATWRPDRLYDLWHDRAVFHFLVDPAARAAYVQRLSLALRPGGHAVIATFAPDGPESCSGLPVQRYSPEGLAQTLGAGFALLDSRLHRHLTPAGRPQSFQYSLLRKSG
jgi:trans-aconitate methyltransferase